MTSLTDTIRTVPALQALFANNNNGEISAQDLRDFLVSSANLITNNIFTIAPQRIEIDLGANDGLIVKGAAGQSGKLFKALDNSNVSVFEVSHLISPTAKTMLSLINSDGKKIELIANATTDITTILTDNTSGLQVGTSAAAPTALVTNSTTQLSISSTGTVTITGPTGSSPAFDSTSGNTRGFRAIDFQYVRASVAQVASGARSSILGGQNNAANGADSTVVGGVSCSASGPNSFATGQSSQSSGTNSVTFGSGCVASAAQSFSSGSGSNASGIASNAANSSTASGDYSHSEGFNCVADAVGSHAGGRYSYAYLHGMQAESGKSLGIGSGDAQHTRVIMSAVCNASATANLTLGPGQPFVLRNEVSYLFTITVFGNHEVNAASYRKELIIVWNPGGVVHQKINSRDLNSDYETFADWSVSSLDVMNTNQLQIEITNAAVVVEAGDTIFVALVEAIEVKYSGSYADA